MYFTEKKKKETWVLFAMCILLFPFLVANVFDMSYTDLLTGTCLQYVQTVPRPRDQ